MSFGVDPRNPLEYAKIQAFLMPCVNYPRAPVSGVGGDYNFPLNTIWRVGKSETGAPPTTGVEGDQWILALKTGAPAQATQNATWKQFSFGSAPPGTIASLSGDDGLTVVETAGNIALDGNVVANSTHAKALFTNRAATSAMNFDIQVSAAIAAGDVTKAGLAAFSSAQFSVNTTTGFVSLSGGTTPPILGVVPDSFTGPGTSPVIPNGSGNIILEGGATFATGTRPKPIRTNSLAANTVDLEIQLAGSNAATSTANNFGVAQFDANQFTVTGGFVQITNFINYVQKATADSPYTASATDFFISCNSTAGAMTINLPNAPTTLRRFIIKDRVGTASASNITITTPGGAVTFDGATSYVLASNYSSVELIFNGTSYEVF